MNIVPIEAFSDNYIWVLDNGAEAIVVDPGEPEGVLAYLDEQELALKAIILTHNHDDHIGGVKEILAQQSSIPVYGPEETAMVAHKIVHDGDQIEILNQTFKVFTTAGHTPGHISYLMGEDLFCGDALFSGGCGRVFTGDYQAQYDALQAFKALPDSVKVYAAHEYTETNLNFALSIEPDNQRIQSALEKVEELRSQDKPTLPSTIGNEKDINLFLQADSLEQFTELRQARDNFTMEGK